LIQTLDSEDIKTEAIHQVTIRTESPEMVKKVKDFLDDYKKLQINTF
jgi:hypothetical protein